MNHDVISVDFHRCHIKYNPGQIPQASSESVSIAAISTLCPAFFGDPSLMGSEPRAMPRWRAGSSAWANTAPVCTTSFSAIWRLTLWCPTNCDRAPCCSLWLVSVRHGFGVGSVTSTARPCCARNPFSEIVSERHRVTAAGLEVEVFYSPPVSGGGKKLRLPIITLKTASP